MGMSRQLRDLSKEYLKDPSGQFFRNLDQVLKLHKASKVSYEDVCKHLNEWMEKHKNG